MQRLILCVCVHVCITLHLIIVMIFKAFELSTTHIILYFIQFTMKIACELNHNL